MARIIELYHGPVSPQVIGGPFAVYVMDMTDREKPRIVASCTGIRDASACNERALEYSDWHDATIKTQMLS